ncbi:uncharacterized protein LOC126689658 [Quercus robur]|uniref:uncharacterized protein LOC126689658 n=1 Tax=Quercus robur TaxID=38942 RepID=UPI002162198B|nr:uncharacterized protein LOC126689658 [Quercus robur]
MSASARLSARFVWRALTGVFKRKKTGGNGSIGGGGLPKSNPPISNIPKSGLIRPAAGLFFQAARFALWWSKYKGYIQGGTQILAFGLSTYCFFTISKRLGSLEQKVEQVDRNLVIANGGINNINADLAEIKGRMDAVIATRATIAANPWLLLVRT